MDDPFGIGEHWELVSPDDALVSGPADPEELEAALLFEKIERKITELKELVSQIDNCPFEDWKSANGKILQDLENWLWRRRLAEVRQNTGRAATESGIFTSDMRELQVAVSGGQFKIDGRDDPLKANHAHEKRTKWNAARKHPERRSDVHKLTARAWNESKELLNALLLLRAIERRRIGGFVECFNASILSETERKASRMEPSARARLLELYDNRDSAGWFDVQVWPRIEEMGEEAIRKEYRGAIGRAKSIQNERPENAKGAFRRSLMGALRRGCKDEFVKIIGPEEFSNNT
jgi:hypothetical protein